MTQPDDPLPQDLAAPVPHAAPTSSVKKRLDRPKSINEVADLVNKIVFGACTIAIAAAAFLLNNSIDEGNRRKELYTFLADTPTEVTTKEQLQKVNFLQRVCNSYLRRVDDEGAKVLCTTLPQPGGATVQQVSQQTAPVAQELARGGDAGKYLASPQATTQSSLVAAAETEVTATQDQDAWFAVVGTVPISQRPAAEALAAQLARIIPSELVGARGIHIYQTKISNSYAITVGDAMPRGDAAKLASALRRIPALNDAFAQPDRDWTRVSPAS